MPKTILVADDKKLIRKLLARVIEGTDEYKLCAEAANGEEAIALAQSCRPDLIILDLSMPVMNGIAAARETQIPPRSFAVPPNTWTLQRAPALPVTRPEARKQFWLL
jgi:CheY-like chemotaxis protein